MTKKELRRSVVLWSMRAMELEEELRETEGKVEWAENVATNAVAALQEHVSRHDAVIQKLKEIANGAV